MTQRPSQVVQDALNRGEMAIPRIMHVEAHLLNCIRYVWSGEGEILQSTNQTAVLSRIADRCTISGGDLSMSVDRGAARLAVSHTSSLKHIQGVLPLRKKEALGTQLHCHTQEVVKDTKILHGEFLLESRDDARKKVHAGGSENNIIDIQQ